MQEDGFWGGGRGVEPFDDVGADFCLFGVEGKGGGGDELEIVIGNALGGLGGDANPAAFFEGAHRRVGAFHVVREG